MSLFVSVKKNLGRFRLDCSFETEGEILGFLGASGCGKSMTLGCIAGIVTPDEGRIVLNGVTLFDSGRNINLPPQKRRVGMLFQNYGLFPNMTVEQNILCGLVAERDRKRKREAAREMMTLDSYLRLQLQTEMKGILQDLRKDVILVSHSRDEIYRLCDKLAIMDQGRILGTGDMKGMFANPKSRQGAVLTGCKNIVEARKAGEYEVEVPQWGMCFVTGEPVQEHLAAIGIRAHYFAPEIGENQGKVVLVDEMEEPFEWILKFRYENAKPGSDSVWWRLPKEKRPVHFPKALGVLPENVMLLYGD